MAMKKMTMLVYSMFPFQQKRKILTKNMSLSFITIVLRPWDKKVLYAISEHNLWSSEFKINY